MRLLTLRHSARARTSLLSPTCADRTSVFALAALAILTIAPAAGAQGPSPAAANSDAADVQPAPAAAPDNEQYDKLLEASKRYQQIASSGGWQAIPDGEPMSPDSDADCARLDALRKRLSVEGYVAAGGAGARAGAPAASIARPHAADDADAAGGAAAQPDDAGGAVAQPNEAGATRSQPRAATDAAAAGGNGNDKATADEPATGCRYAGDLVEGVRSFQHDRRLKVDGEVGASTLRELNVPVQEVTAAIDRALQIWRDKAGVLTGNYVLVNIPAFELAVYEGRREVMRMPVVVGEPEWPTPELEETLEFLVINPEWRIPETIEEADVRPKQKEDPQYFAREGIEKGENGMLRQKPGPRNPLGRIKFMMPNDQDIYLHDTPARRHFASSWRALSHGCIRVEKPLELAEYLLRGSEWSRDKLQAAIDARKTQEVPLPSHVPVHLVYVPAQVNAQGRLEVLPDIYGRFGEREQGPGAPAAADEDGFMPSYP